MKILILIVFMASLISCGKNNSPSIVRPTLDMQKTAKSPSDVVLPSLSPEGIIEINVAGNKVVMEAKSVLDYKKMKSVFWRELALQWMKDKEGDLSALFDEDVHFVSHWTDQEFFPFESKLEQAAPTEDALAQLDLRLKMSFLEEYGDIKELETSLLIYDYQTKGFKKLATFFLEENALDKSYYELKTQKMKATPLYEKFLRRGVLGIQINNFQTANGSYLDTKANRKKKFSRIIMSTPEGTESLYVFPGKTLQESLLSVYSNAEFYRDRIVRINNLRSTVDIFDDLDDLDNNSLSGRAWITSTNLESILVSGQTYVVIYAGGRDFQRMHEPTVLAQKAKITKQLLLGKVHENDLLQFEISGEQLRPRFTMRTFQERITCLVYRDVETRMGSRRIPEHIDATCNVKEKIYSGDERKKMIFSAGGFSGRLRIKVGENLFRLEDVLPLGASISILGNGERIKLSVLIKKEMLRAESEEITLVVLSDATPQSFDLGFINYSSVSPYCQGEISFPYYNAVPTVKKIETKEEYIVTVKKNDTLF